MRKLVANKHLELCNIVTAYSLWQNKFEQVQKERQSKKRNYIYSPFDKIRLRTAVNGC